MAETRNGSRRLDVSRWIPALVTVGTAAVVGAIAWGRFDARLTSVEALNAKHDQQHEVSIPMVNRLDERMRHLESQFRRHETIQGHDGMRGRVTKLEREISAMQR